VAQQVREADQWREPRHDPLHTSAHVESRTADSGTPSMLAQLAVCLMWLAQAEQPQLAQAEQPQLAQAEQPQLAQAEQPQLAAGAGGAAAAGAGGAAAAGAGGAAAAGAGGAAAAGAGVVGAGGGTCWGAGTTGAAAGVGGAGVAAAAPAAAVARSSFTFWSNVLVWNRQDFSILPAAISSPFNRSRSSFISAFSIPTRSSGKSAAGTPWKPASVCWGTGGATS
jgi:hypothetical protein